jgi:hypothetical protein
MLLYLWSHHGGFMTRPCSFLSLIAAQFIAGCCGPDPLYPGDRNGESSGCEVVEETPLDLDGTTPDGDSVLDMVNTMSGSHESTLVWADGVATDLNIEVSDITNARLLDYEVRADSSGFMLDIACLDVIAIDATVLAVSGDGQLNEVLETTISKTEFEGSLQLVIDLDEAGGEFDATEWVTEPSDSVAADLTATWDENGIRGTIDGISTHQDGQIATAMRIDIGSFGAGGH